MGKDYKEAVNNQQSGKRVWSLESEVWSQRQKTAFNELTLDSETPDSTLLLMFEMPYAREDHCKVVFVGCRDDFLIAHGAAGLDYGGDAVSRGFVNAIAEGEEGVGSKYRTFERQLRAHRAKLYGINSGHLSCADSYGLPLARVNDCVRFGVLANGPREQKRTYLFFCRLAFCYNLQVLASKTMRVARLNEHSASDCSVL